MLSGQSNQNQINDLPSGGCHSSWRRYEIRVKDHLDPGWCQWF